MIKTISRKKKMYVTLEFYLSPVVIFLGCHLVGEKKNLSFIMVFMHLIAFMLNFLSLILLV